MADSLARLGAAQNALPREASFKLRAAKKLTVRVQNMMLDILAARAQAQAQISAADEAT